MFHECLIPACNHHVTVEQIRSNALSMSESPRLHAILVSFYDIPISHAFSHEKEEEAGRSSSSSESFL